MGPFEDAIKKYTTETQAKPEIEPGADQIAFAREYRGLYLSLVRSGFTKDEAQAHMMPYLMAWFSKMNRDPDKPWERE